MTKVCFFAVSWSGGVAAALLMACQPFSSKLTGAAELDGARHSLMQTLKKVNVFHPDRLIMHLSHTCSLELQGRLYPVIELREIVPGAMTPRGVNSILILGPDLSLLQRLDYATERPLFCMANRLYVWGDLQVDGLSAEGNELTFDEQGQLVSLIHVEANEIPAWSAVRPAPH